MQSTKIEEASELIRRESINLGFDAVGFARAQRLDEHAPYLQEWLAAGNHADMTWMEGHFEKRIDPRLLVEGTKSVVVVLFSYKPKDVQPADAPQLAKYAYGTDYHIVMKEKLWQLLAKLQQEFPEADGRPFVDSAPVMDRVWAQRAGLGWIGKNSLLLNRQLGSFVLIGTLLLNVELVYADAAIPPSCGECNRCINACPTKAIVAPMVVDARRCISYHTIENRGDIPEKVQILMGNRAFGCDTCQDVCPWNLRVKPHGHQEFMPREAILSFSNSDWSSLSPESFASIFRQSAVKRAKYGGLMRNLSIALRNGGD